MGGVGGLMYVGVLAEGVTTPDDTWLRIPLWILFACLMLLNWEYVYGFLLLAAACYAMGLLAAALTARLKRTPSGGESPPFGAI